jgi:hypothetical protein
MQNGQKAGSTGNTVRPESWNDRKAGMTGKAKRPESWNDRKPNDRENLIGKSVIEKEPVSTREKNQEKELTLPPEEFVRKRINNRPRNGFELV